MCFLCIHDLFNTASPENKETFTIFRRKRYKINKLLVFLTILQLKNVLKISHLKYLASICKFRTYFKALVLDLLV